MNALKNSNMYNSDTETVVVFVFIQNIVRLIDVSDFQARFLMMMSYNISSYARFYKDMFFCNYYGSTYYVQYLKIDVSSQVVSDFLYMLCYYDFFSCFTKNVGLCAITW